MAENNNNWKATAIIFIVLFILGSIFYGLTIIGYLTTEQEYELLVIEWCELSNDEIVFINDLLDNLEYYDEVWSEVDKLEETDCFE